MSDDISQLGRYRADSEVGRLRAENARLRKALELADAALSGANMNMKVVEKKVRAALAREEKKP